MVPRVHCLALGPRWGAFRAASVVLGWVVVGATTFSALAEDVAVPRDRLEALEARSRRVEALEAEVRRLESEIRRLKAVPETAATATGTAQRPSANPPPAPWLTPAAAQAAVQAGPAPALDGRLTEGSTVDLAHVLSHFGADPAAALARYKGVKARFHGVVADVDKPLFMAPFDVVFRRSETPVRVRARVASPSFATRVFVTADRTTVVGDGGGRRQVLARVGDAVVFEGVIKGLDGGMVELVASGGLGPWTGP
jgi:hypothetical protein